MATRRPLKPKPTIAVTPVLASDQTAFTVFGLEPRPFREVLRAHPEIPRTVIGKRVLVDVATVLAALGRKRAGGTR